MAKRQKTMNKNAINSIRTAAHESLTAAGAANGIGNRARLIRSKRDKANCPKRQRKNWRYDAD